MGRVWFYVDAHEHGVVDVAVLLELNDVCALEDAVDPHGCVEKNGGLHGVLSFRGAVCRWYIQCITDGAFVSTCVEARGRGVSGVLCGYA